ncbi:MAG: transglutaminase domain-containing protein [Pirellulales bacterium]|nr:transglutaminase domain-containing protein [Pirellulales bacterium]
MRTPRFSGLFTAAAFCAGWCANVVAAELPQVRHLSIHFKCELDELPPDAKVVDLWVPVPPTNERQTIKLLNEDQLAGGQFTQDKTFRNRLYYRRFDATDRDRPLQVELIYEVEVHEATVPAAKQLISTRDDVPTADFAPYLRDTNKIPIEGKITELALNIDLPKGEPLRAGRAIYDYLVDTMKYNYLARGAGQGDAVWACDSKTGDCTDFHSVFIGVCRWRGIPADHVFGLPLPPEKPEGEAKYCHCWAQFWVAGVGWVPIDASRANKYPKDREYYFGTLGSTWLTLAHGRDVVLEPPQQGPPINMLHGPVAEVDGKPIEHVRWVAHYKDLPNPDAK